MRDQARVKVGSAEARVARRGEDLEGSVLECQEGYVESTTTEVIDEDVAFCGSVLSLG